MALATAALADPTPAAVSVARPSRRRRVGFGALVLAAYLAVSVAVWWQVWSGHPASAMTCGCGDPSLFVASFAWVSHALGHGQDPFLSTATFHPAGMNLLANTSGMLEAIVLAPVTAVFGAIAAVNVADTLAPVLSAGATYWAMRRGLGSGRIGAFVAGLFVEVSPAVVGSVALSHLQVGMLAFVPLIGVCLHQLLGVQQSPPWRWGALLAAAAVGQFFAGTELFVLLALFSAATVAAAFVAYGIGIARRSPGAAARARHAAVGIGVGGGAAIACLAGPAWFALAGPRHFSGEPWSGSMGHTGGRLDTTVTSASTEGAGLLIRLSGYLGPFGAPLDHLGWAAVIAAVVAVAVLRRRPVVWALAAVAVLALWCSLGMEWATPGSSRPVWVPFLPWAALGRLPILRDALAQNVVVLTVVAVALLVGLLVDRVRSLGRGRLRLLSGLAAAGLAVGVILPLASAWDLPLTAAPVRPPAWFVRDAPRLPAGSVVLAEPLAGPPGDGETVVWQAMGHDHFALAGGFGLVPGPTGAVDHGGQPGSATRALAGLNSPVYAPPPSLTDATTMATVRAAMTSWGVTTVVVTDRVADPSYAVRWFTALLGRPPMVQDGASVWTVGPS